MTSRLLKCASALALLSASAPSFAFAADVSQQELLAKVQKQDAEIQALKEQLTALTAMVKGNQAAPTEVVATKKAGKAAAPASVEKRLADVETKIDEQGKVLATRVGVVERSTEGGKIVMNGPQPRFESPDGSFTAALRTLVQFDSAYYIQDNQPVGGTGQDLSSGANFRRARFGIDGTILRNFDYSFIYEFGGSGVESAGQIQQAYLQYSGLRPFYIRAGAFAPYAGLEDSTGAGETLFMERASVSEITRSMAASDGRDGVSLVYSPDRYFLSLAYTGAKVTQAAVFDEQQGAVGRAAGLLYTDKNTNILLGVNGSYIWDLPDSTAGAGSVTGIVFSDRPELRVDGTSLISAGSTASPINAQSAYHYGIDGGFNFNNLYGEAGYFRFGADRRGTTSDPEFSGFYVQGSWVITGEARRYNAQTAAWKVPKVDSPFSGGANSGWGAWELAGRYSMVDLNWNAGRAGAATPTNGIRGGEQDVWSAILNWYPSSALRVGLEYQWVSVDRLNGTTTPPPANSQIGQDFQTVSARVQVGF